MRSNVDFPAPFGPMRPMRSPSSMVKLTPSNSGRAPKAADSFSTPSRIPTLALPMLVLGTRVGLRVGGLHIGRLHVGRLHVGVRLGAREGLRVGFRARVGLGARVRLRL